MNNLVELEGVVKVRIERLPDRQREVLTLHLYQNLDYRVSPDAPGGDIRGSEEKWWSEARAAFPDMTFAVNLLIESGDLIVSNWTLTGTHTGTAFYDVAPSGEPVTINGTAILRIRDGKIVEHWGGPHCEAGLGLRPRVDTASV